MSEELVFQVQIQNKSKSLILNRKILSVCLSVCPCALNDTTRIQNVVGISERGSKLNDTTCLTTLPTKGEGGRASGFQLGKCYTNELLWILFS